MMRDQRIVIASLTISAAALLGIATHEGFVGVAEPPVRGDVPTYGFGTTRHQDGSPVRDGERIDPVRALKYLYDEADESAQAVRRCAPVPMHQHEFDAFVSLTYNIGRSAFCNSTLARRLKAQDYAAACREILRWDKFQGKQLPGLTARRQNEYRQCVGENTK